MREAIIVGFALGFVGLVLLLRGLVGSRSARGEENTPSPVRELSEQERIQLAVMHDRMIRMLP
jgi:hypothetical protein